MNNYQQELYHHGIKGQEWGVRNGPPYPLGSGDHSTKEKKSHWKSSLKKTAANNKPAKKRKQLRNKQKEALKKVAIGLGVVGGAGALSYVAAKYGRQIVSAAKIKNALAKGYTVENDYSELGKHYADIKLKKGSTLHTLARSQDRIDGSEYFFAAHTKRDINQYRKMFGKQKAKGELQAFNKFDITSKVVKDMKVAGEDASEKVFRDLFRNNDDFRDFVINDKRMMSNSFANRMKYKAYRQDRNFAKNMVGKKVDDITNKDINKAYKYFNFSIVSTPEDAVKSLDLSRQKSKYFNAMKEKGYSGILDTNDAIYGGYKSQSPIIVFDQSAIAKKAVKQLTDNEIKRAGIQYDASKIIDEQGVNIVAGLAGSTATATGMAYIDHISKEKVPNNEKKK